MRLFVKTSTAVLISLLKIQEKYLRTYSCVRRVTIQKHLKKYYGINVSLSDVSYHLGRFYKYEILRYWKRSRLNEDGTYTLLPSNRQITGKGIRYLLRLGIKVLKMLQNWAFKGVKPKIYKGYSDIPWNSSIITTPQKRSPGTFESIGDVLSKLKSPA
ncbi:hypothetical protein ES703_10471 [subsurface metagenome]